jgi:hypothetical protein
MGWKGRGHAARGSALVAFVASSFAIFGGCHQTTESTAATCSGQTATPADPACTRDTDCPSGSFCGTGTAGGTTATCSASDGGPCRCLPAYFPDVSPDILITEFDVREFDLQVTPGSVTEYAWTAPSGATVVVCGMFVAAPEVTTVPLTRIDNAFTSLYRTHVFRVPDLGNQMLYTTQFTIGDLTSPPSADCGGTGDRLNSFPPPNEAYPVVTTLQVACWAYDDDAIVAATRLRNLQLGDLPETLPPVDDCASLPAGTPDGRLCLLSPLVGGCIDQMCNPDAGLASLAASSNMDDASTAGTGSTTAPAGPPAPAPTTPATSTPVATCADASDMTLCQLTSDFQFGRCVGSRCADQHVTQPDLPLVTADCAQPASTNQGTDWLNCFDDDVQGYGTCYGGSCLLRCVNDADCVEVQKFLGGADAGGPLRCAKLRGSKLTCSGDGTSFLGLCVPGGSSCP